ncbi:MAG: NPCBM/NEW2 domain-containing protein, partial [Planctomycetes bacterium]|nr:NPCBM/NEW2 domain-containing protein [Planctomycetota bacterium]
MRWKSLAIAALVLSPVTSGQIPARAADFLGDKTAGISMSHEQQWGDFGLNVAAAATGGAGAPLQIGDKRYDRGLGHHANGEIVVDLQGQYELFHALLGVQWQGGDRGSVTFRIAVDGKTVFETGPMSDSDPAKEVEVPLVGARELRLIANDSGDGIGCDMANWVEASLERDPTAPFFGKVAVSLCGVPAPPASPAACGFSLVAAESGPQLALLEPARAFTVSVESGEEVRLTIPAKNLVEPVKIIAEATVVAGAEAEVELSLGAETIRRTVPEGASITLETPVVEGAADASVVLATRGVTGETGVRWRGLRFVTEDRTVNVPLLFPATAEPIPPPVLPNLRPVIERELVEWDWRMQDGIGTEREPRTWQEAATTVVERGDRLIQDLKEVGVDLGDLVKQWEGVRAELAAAGEADDSRWEDLWRRVHVLRRQIVLANPLADVGPVAFVKRVPSAMSHQLTQYAGRCARPGGGVFVLEAPGESMRCRRLAPLPTGSPLHLDVSCDGRRVLFSFCEIEGWPRDWRTNEDQHYRLFEVDADGSNLRQLTDEPYDDFSPRYLPDGKILFLSTRRGGFHRCGRGPCPVHAMAVADADGSQPRVISFHETHEWDPAV